MQQPKTGVRGCSDKAMLSILLKRSDSLPPHHTLFIKTSKALRQEEHC